MKSYLNSLWKSWYVDSDCSAPRIFGIKKWWTARFNDICKQHDILYKQRVWNIKWASDFEMCSLIAARGYIILAILSFIGFATIGTIYWVFKKWN